MLKKGRKKLLVAIVALLLTLGVASVASPIIAYESIFTRYDRPNYALNPGEYYYPRVSDRLYRETFTFKSNKSDLAGYYYPSNDNKGLVVVSHGFHAGADDMIPVIEYLVNSGYSVFTFDGTGTYDSGGEDVVGMCQALIDLDYALNYIKTSQKHKNQPLYLLGYSRGGYASASVLNMHRDIRAVALISSMNDGNDIMVQKAEEYVGKLAYISKPVFDAYQKIIFGDYFSFDGVKGINYFNGKVIIAHGDSDTVVRYDTQSISANKEKITNPNAVYYTFTGIQGGHESILLSKNAVFYREQINLATNGLSDEEKEKFYQTIDHALYSQINAELMEKIVTEFDKALD